MKRSCCYCDELSELDTRGWFERVLLFILPHLDIIKTSECPACNGPGSDCWECFATGRVTRLSLRRFYIWRSSWVGKNWGNLCLHKTTRWFDGTVDPRDYLWKIAIVG